VTYLGLVPEALVVVAAVLVLLAGRLGWLSPGARRALPAIVAAVTLVALGIELWAGATLATHFEGGLVQDRFALFAKAAVLLTATIAFAVVDWTAEDSLLPRRRETWSRCGRGSRWRRRRLWSWSRCAARTLRCDC
jgi:NADH:ubiquinone oxidoreductase subunit 2 (subunit N)